MRLTLRDEDAIKAKEERVRFLGGVPQRLKADPDGAVLAARLKSGPSQNR
jgi:hypothetical protein